MKPYASLYTLYREQEPESAFASFFAIQRDYDEPSKLIARQSLDGFEEWQFHQDRFLNKYPHSAVPKLKNYLNYTFKRLVELESMSPGSHFLFSSDGEWASFNTGLHNSHGSDMLAIFQGFRRKPEYTDRPMPDWVYKGCYTPTDRLYRDRFGNQIPEIAWYSTDSRDFVFDTSYSLDKEVFDHLFERAKERAGLPNASDEVVRNYLRGALENLVPKIRRNYKVAIPVFYIEESRMQMLLPFVSASNANDVSAFLVERDDVARCYRLKTVYDLDQAYFAARLITRPDKDWLNP